MVAREVGGVGGIELRKNAVKISATRSGGLSDEIEVGRFKKDDGVGVSEGDGGICVRRGGKFCASHRR